MSRQRYRRSARRLMVNGAHIAASRGFLQRLGRLLVLCLLVAWLVHAVWCAVPAHAATPPVGQIVYVGGVVTPGQYGGEEVWLVNADGSAPRRIFSGHGPIVALQWSPDGMRLAVVAQWIGEDPGLWILSADGTGAHELTLQLPAAAGLAGAVGDMGGVAWSPDARRIAVSYTLAAEDWGKWSSWILTADAGTGATQIFVGPKRQLRYHELAWSPDRAEILASTSSIVGESGWLSRFDTASAVELDWAAGPGFFEFWSDPAYSPAGDRAACEVSSQAAAAGGPGADFWHIEVATPSGTSRRTVVSSAEGAVKHPSWSPDGRWLAYTQY